VNGRATASEESPAGAPLLEVRGVTVRFPGDGGPVTILDKVDLAIGRGEILGLVGESGCGKSMLARSILRVVPHPGRIVAGEIRLQGEDLLKLGEGAIRDIRGDRISVILQEPMTSLNPVFTIGNQIVEVLAKHRPGMSPRERRDRAVEMLTKVGIQSAADRLRQYPHELSGGIRQRVMIAIALICGGVELLIADEPTTALDVTIQAQILELFIGLQAEHRMAMLLITHDLSVIAQTAHTVAVMYAGRIVEQADVVPIFEAPLHPYTRGLLSSLPRRGTGRRKSPMPSIAGAVPNLAHLPPGCPFCDRCPHRRDDPCRTAVPPLEDTGDGRKVRCFRWRELGPLAVATQATA
jgi:oligopeptide transport system ATP-binding protein